MGKIFFFLKIGPKIVEFWHFAAFGDKNRKNARICSLKFEYLHENVTDLYNF